MTVRTFVREHRFGAWLSGVAVAGLAWRIVYDVLMRHNAVGGDGFRYHYGALFLADGRGFATLTNLHLPDTGHPPGWTVLLAGAPKLGLRTWLEHGLVASVVGTATIVMTGLAARAAFGSRVGIVAATIAAFYPNMFLYEREVLSEPLAMLGIATMIWLAYKFRASPSLILAVAIGAVLGALAMTKADQIAMGVVLVLPLVLARRSVTLRDDSVGCPPRLRGAS